MPEISSAVNTNLRDCNVLFYDIKYMSKKLFNFEAITS